MFEVAACRRAVLLVLGIPVYVYVEAETPRGLARSYARIRGLQATARFQSSRLPFHDLMRNARCYAPLGLALKSLLDSDDELGKIDGRRHQTTRTLRIQPTATVRDTCRTLGPRVVYTSKRHVTRAPASTGGPSTQAPHPAVGEHGVRRLPPVAFMRSL